MSVLDLKRTKSYTTRKESGLTSSLTLLELNARVLSIFLGANMACNHMNILLINRSDHLTEPGDTTGNLNLRRALEYEVLEDDLPGEYSSINRPSVL